MTGSEKQIAWAKRIQADYLETMLAMYNFTNEEMRSLFATFAREYVDGLSDSSRFWIEEMRLDGNRAITPNRKQIDPKWMTWLENQPAGGLAQKAVESYGRTLAGQLKQLHETEARILLHRTNLGNVVVNIKQMVSRIDYSTSEISNYLDDDFNPLPNDQIKCNRHEVVRASSNVIKSLHRIASELEEAIAPFDAKTVNRQSAGFVHPAPVAHG